ncbi:hypothetical protein D1007_28398 [Hordeum vulgare]|nr:hypothetical protein D1007_28398 [Hordeum vulgare]
MQYTGTTYHFPPTVLGRLYPTGVYVDRTLRVWAISRLMTARNFTEFFLASGYHHLPRGSPMMFRVEEVIQNRVLVALLAHFTNTFDVVYLLGRVFWCGSELIDFTTHNRFTE